MRPLLDMDTIQIEVTNACVHTCANCTRLVGHSEKPFFMSMDEFRVAVDSLTDFPKMVGMMGGEPLIHPLFKEMAEYLHSRIPRERCGLWSTLPRGKEYLAPVIAEVFGSVLLNDHTHGDIYHAPVLVSPEDMDVDEFTKWYRIEHCWVQNSWSASITPKGAFFCEIAGALDMVFQGPGGWKVQGEWWKKTPRDYVAQMERYCRMCGAAFPLKARRDTDAVDDVSESMLARLQKLHSPKVSKGSYALYQSGFVQDEQGINQFRRDNSYFEKIAGRYNLGLRPNHLNYLEPYLLESESNGGDRNRAQLALDQGDAAMAAELYALCLNDAPKDVDLLFGYASALNLLKQYDVAVGVLHKALAEEPANLQCTLLLAFCLHNQNRFEEAHHYYCLAKRLGAFNLTSNASGNFFYLAGIVATETGRMENARDDFKQAFGRDPEHIAARLLYATVGPYMPSDCSDVDGKYLRYQQELLDAIQHVQLDTPEGRQRAFVALGNTTPYYLAYLGKNDVEAQRIYGTFVTQLISARSPELSERQLKVTALEGRKLKIGFVSAHFYNHSVWKIITSGWLKYLDRERFQVSCYSTGTIRDGITEQARQLSDSFFESQDIDGLARTILENRHDVLIYPGVGMDHHTQLLAATRLAPVQCVAWGHPVTTGMPTVDYFLSSALMEPPDGDNHYTEQLVRLPNISVCYELLDLPEQESPPELESASPHAVRFLCCQNLLKYQPKYDDVFARIAALVPTACFVFIDFGGGLKQILLKRLDNHFRQKGLVLENHLLFVPKQGPSGYAALNAGCDIYLDSIGWSGGNTTLESLPYDKPIVTMTGPFMRGRHTAAILTMMGVTETIATNQDEYVNIAARLALDTSWRQSVVDQVRQNKNKVYHDTECVRALEAFLEQAVSRAIRQAAA